MARTLDRNLFVFGWWAAVAAAIGWPAAARAETWDGPKLNPVSPEPVCEFTQPPAFKQVGKDRYEISFASKARCDVAVAIHDASGRIVRHVVYGVLGANAPEPLAPDRLDQTLVWDGKDDVGRYVPDPKGCRARVSLGLDPAFDKLLDFHPKDITGRVIGLAADPDGVYVLETSCRNQLRMFSHDGKYVRTIWPYPGDKLSANAPYVATRKVEEDGRTVPQLGGIGGIVPLVNVLNANSMAVSAVGGRMAFFTVGEAQAQLGNERRLLRFHTDGTAGGEKMVGAIFAKGYRSCTSEGHIALSPDGRWVYVSGMAKGSRQVDHNNRPPHWWNSVFRFAWDAAGPILAEDSFLGEIGRGPPSGGAGDDNAHFNGPEGMATDSAGRLYVCDSHNKRVQVFSPDGKHLKTIQIDQPQEIAVHQSTGEIYVMCFRRPTGDRRYTPIPDYAVVKFGPLDAPLLKWKKEFRLNPPMQADPAFCLDSWSKPPRVWLTERGNNVRVYSDLGDKLEPFDDFEADVAKAGLNPHMLGGNLKNRLEVDTTRNHLYYMRGGGAPLRCDDLEGPGRFTRTAIPGQWEEMDFSTKGLLYLRALRYLARFDPDKAVVSDGQIVFGENSEVPFDYGEGQEMRFAPWKLKGAIVIAALPGANSFDTGIGIGPHGDIVAFMKNYRTYQDMLWGRDKDKWVDAWGARNMEEVRTTGYLPRNFPGRNYGGGELVMKWSDRGEPVGEDLVPALPMPSCGVKIDRYGAIYCGVGANMYYRGKPHSAGALAKFSPAGGKLFGKGDVAKLDPLPDRPPEFTAYGWGDLWTQNMYWAYPGYDQMHFLGNPYPCLCSTCRFDMDLYGRCFVPKAYQYTVGVLDTNGNRICEIGRYGNPESPAMQRGESQIGIAHCSFLAVDSDRWLYLNDSGNSRIIRVKLGYRAEQFAPMN